MARISLNPPQTHITRIAIPLMKRIYGKALEPALAVAHNSRVSWTYLRFEGSLRRWNKLDPTLKLLAEIATAQRIGCSWCMDFGFWQAHHDGIDLAKLEATPQFATSPLFSELERKVMAYAVAMSGEGAEVTDEMVAGLREHLNDAQLVELTMMIAVENQRSRFNSALGLHSQGFSDSCRGRAVA